MSIADFFYILFIWPVRVIIEFIYVLFYLSLNDNASLAIILLSIAVNCMLLPIYSVADRWQKEERLLQKNMKQKLKDIRAVFKGDERQMIINTYYRQMGYSPFNALKSSMGLLMQIPFFLAAYQLLSHSPTLDGASFFFLQNLAEPDGLIQIGRVSINLLPVVMTAINIFSSFVYTKDLNIRERIQLLVISFVFLFLLYDSPSGLVLYWTMNNIFSLGKNIVYAAAKKPAKFLYWASVAAAGLLLIVALTGAIRLKAIFRLVLGAIAVCILLAPFLWKGLLWIGKKFLLSAKESTVFYFSCCAVLCVFLGLLLPSQVIASSPVEFDNPGIFIFRTFLQSLAFSALVPFLIWSLLKQDARKAAVLIAAVLTVVALISGFGFNTSYGTMTRDFRFEIKDNIKNAFPLSANLVIITLSVAICAFFVMVKKTKWLRYILNAAAAAIFILGVVNIAAISTEKSDIASNENIQTLTEGEKIYNFTATGRNNVIIFLDRAIGVAMYKALEVYPELVNEFEGFTFYPNTLSFSWLTLIGVPSLLGGYDYTPSAINDRPEELLPDKINEAITMLPKLFGEAGYRVAYSDPKLINFKEYPDYSVFEGMENVTVKSALGLFAHRFREEHNIELGKFRDTQDYDILFRYSIFRVALPVLRYNIYNSGRWLRYVDTGAFHKVMQEFPPLYYLADLCNLDDEADTLNIIMNEITHNPGAINSSLKPQPGAILFSQEEKETFQAWAGPEYMYTFLAAMKAITTWLDFLKQNGVYDNTRIIVVSDHGFQLADPFFEEPYLSAFNPLLLVKEPTERGPLKISPEFMTHSDTPAIISVDFDNPVNPYRKTALNTAGKKRPLTVYDGSNSTAGHDSHRYILPDFRVFYGDDIFKKESWGLWERIE